MTWYEILQKIADGAGVARAAWGEDGPYIEAEYTDATYTANGEKFGLHKYDVDGTDVGMYRPTAEDKAATDWQVV